MHMQSILLVHFSLITALWSGHQRIDCVQGCRVQIQSHVHGFGSLSELIVEQVCCLHANSYHLAEDEPFQSSPAYIQGNPPDLAEFLVTHIILQRMSNSSPHLHTRKSCKHAHNAPDLAEFLVTSSPVNKNPINCLHLSVLHFPVTCNPPTCTTCLSWCTFLPVLPNTSSGVYY